MSGVMLHVAFDRRETGAGRDARIERSLRQAKRIAGDDAAGFVVIETEGRTPTELAGDVLGKAGWLPFDT